MVEPIYCLKPAWCGRHLAGLRPETGLTVRYGATAFKAVGYHFREGSKAAQAYALLCRPEGVTVREIQNATGWQRHTVRGFVSASVRKQGSRVRSFQRGGERVYQVKS